MLVQRVLGIGAKPPGLRRDVLAVVPDVLELGEAAQPDPPFFRRARRIGTGAVGAIHQLGLPLGRDP
jgi:hypothetical protein